MLKNVLQGHCSKRKEHIMKLLFYVLLVGLIGLITLFGLDREMARQDYLSIVNNESDLVSVDGCLLQMNCDYYNDLLKETK